MAVTFHPMCGLVPSHRAAPGAHRASTPTDVVGEGAGPAVVHDGQCLTGTQGGPAVAARGGDADDDQLAADE